MIREVIRGVVLGVWLGCFTATSAQPEAEVTTETQTTPDCQQWNTRDYFNKATPKGVAACLEAGADPNAKTWLHQVTPLHHAASAWKPGEDPQIMLEIKADLESGKTLAEEVVEPERFLDFEPRSTKIVKVLLKAGADPNAKTREGITPLHEAADLLGVYTTIEVLLNAGADPMARDHEGRTPLHISAESRLTQAELLMKAGADPNARDIVGNTPLHRAARSGNPDIIEVLLNAGADLMVRNEKGNSPLHEASQTGYVSEDGEKYHSGDEIKALLDAGADPTARNGKGQTPWDLARDNQALKGSDAYWRLNDARFKSPGRGEVTPPMTSPTPTGGAEAPAGGPCQIAGYPRPADVNNLGLPWCPASVDFQVRAFALQAAGAQCALSMGGATPRQAESIRKEIRAACDMLAAWGEATDCKCPPGFGQ